MKKTLEQLLLEMNTDRPSRSKNRIAFLRHWPEIKAMLDKGWTLKCISQALQESGSIDLGYEGLRKLVSRQRKLEEKDTLPEWERKTRS